MMLLSQRYELRADFTTQQCEKRYLNDTFRPFGIPYDAKYVDTLEIGSNIEPDLGIEVYVWEGTDTQSKHDIVVITMKVHLATRSVLINPLCRFRHIYQYIHNQRLPSSG